jgi:hypothetical protein
VVVAAEMVFVVNLEQDLFLLHINYLDNQVVLVVEEQVQILELDQELVVKEIMVEQAVLVLEAVVLEVVVLELLDVIHLLL